jgi:hypothetical protein
MSDLRAGRATHADVDKAIAQAETLQAEEAARAQTTALPAEAPHTPRDVLELSAPAPVKRDALDLAAHTTA